MVDNRLWVSRSEMETMFPRAPICPYCGNPSIFHQSSEHLYHGKNYGPVYECSPCGAWVGCHPGTARPLGRLANRELREAKIAAHNEFDRLWRKRYVRKHAVDSRYTKGMARGGRYKELAILLNIPREECHIGMFDVDQCKRVRELCRSGALNDHQD